MKPYTYTPEEFRGAPSGIGALADEWADKPHRVLYDAAIQLAEANKRVEALEKALLQIRGGVILMVPEPQKTGFKQIIDTALLPAEDAKEQKKA